MKLKPVTVPSDAHTQPAPDDPEQLQRSDDAVIFRAAQLFLGDRAPGLSPSEIATQISAEFDLRPKLTREAIYPMISEAIRRGFLRLVPPVHQQLAERVRAKYPNLKGVTLSVVQTAGQHDNAKVSAVAAELAFAHLQDIIRATNDPTVSVGLGPGRATLDFCRAFSGLLAGYPEPVKLRLVAISAGCPANAPEYLDFLLQPFPQAFGRGPHRRTLRRNAGAPGRLRPDQRTARRQGSLCRTERHQPRGDLHGRRAG